MQPNGNLTSNVQKAVRVMVPVPAGQPYVAGNCEAAQYDGSKSHW
jgi:hypothetical protein